ncbi:hypothetical protein U1Q18_015063, partial [Sarracenia purpurea var. burkii]
GVRFGCAPIVETIHCFQQPSMMICGNPSMRVLPSSGSIIEGRSSLAIGMRSGPKPTDLVTESGSIGLRRTK